MNFRSEVKNGARRPKEAMIWIDQIESTKSIAELKTSKAIIGAKFPDKLRGSRHKK